MRHRMNAALLLLAAGVATTLAGANFMVSLGAWLAPIFMLRFLRLHRPWLGLGLGALVQVAGWIIGWRGVLPFSDWFSYGLIVGVALIMWVPYVADRLLAPRISGFASTLLFPLVWVAVEFHFSMAGYGTWGAVAYTQWGNLPLLQLVGITGLWGITFLIGWTATVVNWIWERKYKQDLGAALYATVMTLVLLSGGLRLALFVPEGETVQVASISVDNMHAFMETWGPLQQGRVISSAQAEEIRTLVAGHHVTLLDASHQQAENGAKIILWSEGNALVLKQDEADLIDQGRRLAAEQQIYLFMSLAVITPGQPLVENKTVGIGPDGEMLGEYLKRHPTPVEQAVVGDGEIPVVDTPYGRIAWAICFDYDFPPYIRQAGRARADIMLNPSWDSPGMAPLHSYMAAVRAVETGAAMVRQTNEGLSLAVDHLGRVLSQMDHAATAGPVRVMTSHVPTRGSSTTAYSRVGDLFAWGALGALAILILVSLRSIFRPLATPGQSAPLRSE